MFQSSSIIQKSTICTIPLFTLERMFVYYLTPTTNQRGISIGRIHSRQGQQAIMQHMRRSLEQRRLGSVNRVLEENAPTKSPRRG